MAQHTPPAPDPAAAPQPRDWDLRADVLSTEALASGDPTAWFDRLYAEGAAGEVGMPWERDEPQAQFAPWFEAWLARHGGDGRGRRAVVVGCGLGADAEHLAAHGFETVGFDVAPTAIEQAKARHAGSTVEYRVADLLDLDPGLVGRFDLVVEIFTLQALPNPPRAQAAAAIASLLAPGGTLVLVAFRDTGLPAPELPPYPLTESDLLLVETGGVVLTATAEVADGERWLVTYERPDLG
ncbi:methyltransferase domain-containing protein [Nocardioides marinquilinus]|uniref:Methyltransferase domain-containing protein n=1 Tax=Nocardioides marinquilinus TaxID=1210400 RepID=A0ABP9PTV8_9ACTN